MNGVGPLNFINDIMDQFVYRDIMQNVMLPYAEWKMPLRFIFQQDNDWEHFSRVVLEWFQENNVRVLQWPVQSSDLNPSENFWEKVERGIRTRNVSKYTIFDK